MIPLVMMMSDVLLQRVTQRVLPEQDELREDKRTGATKESAVWWLKYSLHGTRYRESSHTTNRPEAVRLLKKRIAEMDKGRIVGPRVEKTMFEDLTNLIRTDYITNKRRSAARLEGSLRHLESRFALTRAVNIGSAHIAGYIRGRLEENAANATINRKLSALKRMFRLGEESELVAEAPPISLLREDNARKGLCS